MVDIQQILFLQMNSYHVQDNFSTLNTKQILQRVKLFENEL